MYICQKLLTLFLPWHELGLLMRRGGSNKREKYTHVIKTIANFRKNN